LPRGGTTGKLDSNVALSSGSAQTGLDRESPPIQMSNSPTNDTPTPRPLAEIEAVFQWLKCIQAMLPEAFLCLESRPLSECKTLSAAVFSDPPFETTTVFVNVSLAWLASWQNLSEIRPQGRTTEERPLRQQIVVHNDTIYEFNNVTEVDILLVRPDHKATFIRFPWSPIHFDLLQKTRRWIFWSLADETDRKSPFYWGYGNFASSEAFEDYVSQRIDSRKQAFIESASAARLATAVASEFQPVVMDNQYLTLNSTQFLAVLNSTKPDLAPRLIEWCWQPGESWPPPTGTKDSILRRHSGLRRRVACDACSAPAQKAEAEERISRELWAALKLNNPVDYYGDWEG